MRRAIHVQLKLTGNIPGQPDPTRSKHCLAERTQAGGSVRSWPETSMSNMVSRGVFQTIAITRTCSTEGRQHGCVPGRT